MAKNIVVCSDGTGNAFDERATKVSKLYLALTGTVPFLAAAGDTEGARRALGDAEALEDPGWPPLLRIARLKALGTADANLPFGSDSGASRRTLASCTATSRWR